MGRRSERRAHHEARFDRPEPEEESKPTLPPRQDCRRRALPQDSRHLGDELWETPNGRMFYVVD